MQAASAWRIRLAIRCLKKGGIIAYPTEAVWGLGCDPWNDRAVSRLLGLKQRSWNKGLILVAADVHQLAPVLSGLEQEVIQKLEASWPGPATWLVPDNGALPPWVTGNTGKVAVRVSDHPLVQALCKAFAAPLISTSANRQGLPPARTPFKVRKYFGSGIDCIVPGALGGLNRPTEIRDALTGVVVRPASEPTEYGVDHDSRN